MTKIEFYRQGRADGGVRAGVGVNGVMVFEHFAPGRSESNPALRWYVDVRLEGRSLPCDPDSIREWLCEESGFIRQGLIEAADELQLGLDIDAFPFVHELHDSPSGIRAKVVVSGAQRLAEGELAKKVHETGRQWVSTLKKMQPFANV